MTIMQMFINYVLLLSCSSVLFTFKNLMIEYVIAYVYLVKISDKFVYV